MARLEQLSLRRHGQVVSVSLRPGREPWGTAPVRGTASLDAGDICVRSRGLGRNNVFFWRGRLEKYVSEKKKIIFRLVFIASNKLSVCFLPISSLGYPPHVSPAVAHCDIIRLREKALGVSPCVFFSFRLSTQWVNAVLPLSSVLVSQCLSGVSEQPPLLLRGDLFFVCASEQPRTHAEVSKERPWLRPV